MDAAWFSLEKHMKKKMFHVFSGTNCRGDEMHSWSTCRGTSLLAALVDYMKHDGYLPDDSDLDPGEARVKTLADWKKYQSCGIYRTPNNGIVVELEESTVAIHLTQSAVGRTFCEWLASRSENDTTLPDVEDEVLQGISVA